VRERFCQSLVSAALALTFGCVSASEVIPPQMSAETGCPADTISVNKLPGNNYNYRAAGCGFTGTFVCTRSYWGDIGHCVKRTPRKPFRRGWLLTPTARSTELPGDAYRAAGCGQTATFVCTLAEYSGIQNPLSCVKEGVSSAAPLPSATR
jgi:hypothetical protein